MFLCSLPQGCSVHPSWHCHHDPLLISTQRHHTRPKLSSALSLPMGLSSSSGIFRELCSSRVFGLREVTPGQQADGVEEMGESHKWKVPMLLCAAVCPKTQPSCASVSPSEGVVSYKVTRLWETPVMGRWYISADLPQNFFRADPPCRSPDPEMHRAGLLKSPSLCLFSQTLHVTPFCLGAAEKTHSS